MSEPFIGEIRTVGFNYAPQGWALCEGQLLAIADYNALFALLGTTYGGDGRQTFGLPDLRGRGPIGIGRGPGLSDIRWGEQAGTEQVTLQTPNLPPHSAPVSVDVAVPAVSASDNQTDTPAPNTHLGPLVAGGRGGELYSTDNPDTALASFKAEGTTTSVGGGIPVDTRNPYLGTYFIIALTGIFPPRN